MAPLDLRTLPGHAALRPGEWAAVAGDRVIAHGHDLHEVAQEACRKASDIEFQRVPDPQAPTWQPDPALDDAIGLTLPQVRRFASHADEPPRRATPPPPSRH